jgi:hypothetical protein
MGWYKQVTAHGALAWGRAGTCTHMLTYIDTYRARNWSVHERAGVGVESCFGSWGGCRMAELVQEGEIL